MEATLLRILRDDSDWLCCAVPSVASREAVAASGRSSGEPRGFVVAWAAQRRLRRIRVGLPAQVNTIPALVPT